MFRRFAELQLPDFRNEMGEGTGEPTLTGSEKTWPASKILLLGLRRALAMRVGGRLVGRVTAALCLCGFFHSGGMIALAVQLGSGLMRLGSGSMILSGFRMSGHWHW